MLVYRIAHTKYSRYLFAPGLAGRWNGDGRKVIYTAESIPLAFMENIVRRQGMGFTDLFDIMIIEIPGSLKVTSINPIALANGWKDPFDYSICQPLGNDWYDKGLTPILKVPSAILTTNFNFVINTTHADFPQIRLLDTTPLVPDDRIEDILKNYSPNP